MVHNKYAFHSKERILWIRNNEECNAFPMDMPQSTLGSSLHLNLFSNDHYNCSGVACIWRRSRLAQKIRFHGTSTFLGCQISCPLSIPFFLTIILRAPRRDNSLQIYNRLQQIRFDNRLTNQDDRQIRRSYC